MPLVKTRPEKLLDMNVLAFTIYVNTFSVAVSLADLQHHSI
ncbi:hypothetical protein VCHA56P521_210051 [Vibrio chagasii]|nr:hypothetical protein VCHA36P168_160072 [Vibrio chagasii]CAH7062630.1 hypothetical protein VCHA52P461_170028 [Vibrio chagasii]CAH7313408.1 hypothetical protein VCHA37P203_210053 [Vibrio chagasii]CAH7331257.1 hypothetical protein VCHA56P521_210051 [Vibrio chagasii]